MMVPANYAMPKTLFQAEAGRFGGNRLNFGGKRKRATPTIFLQNHRFWSGEGHEASVACDRWYGTPHAAPRADSTESRSSNRTGLLRTHRDHACASRTFH